MNGQRTFLAAGAIAGLLVLTALIALPAISDRTPFFTKGEPREALVVQTIVRGDAIVLPMRNGDELPSKPPLFHWLAALASVIHGQTTEGSIRLPGLIAATGTAAATAMAAWAWWGPATALVTVFVLATSFQWVSSSVSARVDMVLATCITLALLLSARAIEKGRRIPGLAYAMLTAATLTKGPIGFVLPCAILLVTLALRGELGFLGRRDIRLLAAAIAAAGLWYVAAVAIGGDAFIAKQILKENFYRVIDPDSVEAGHVRPFWYYIPLLAAGLAPWSLFVPGLSAFAFASISSATDGSPGDDAPRSGTGAETPPVPDTATSSPRVRLGPSRRFDPHTIFALVWGGVTFALFSLAGSKRSVYLLPAYPAYAMLVARSWTRVIGERPTGIASAALFAGAGFCAGLLVIVGMAVLGASLGLPLDGWIRSIVSNADANNVAPMIEATLEHRSVVLPCAFAMIAASWFTMRAARRGQWAEVVAATAVAMIALSATVSTTLLPSLAEKRSARSFLVRVGEKVPLGTPLSFYRAFDYGAVFYRGAPIPLRSSLADVPEIDGAWLLTWPALLPALAEEARKQGTDGGAAGAYEVEEALASEDVDPSDQTSLVLVRIVRRIGDEHSDGN